MPSLSAPPETPRPRRRIRVFALADRGMSMAHLDGKVAFVPRAAPGDTVEVEVVREKRRYVTCRLLEVVTPSPLRRPPACPHFGRCGGCHWQHLPYPDQLAAKDRSFRGFVRSRLGAGAEGRFRDPIPSPRELGYRNRVGWKVRRLGDRVGVGYFAEGTHRLVPVAACPVAHPALEGLLEPLTRFLQGFRPARGHLPQVDLQVDGEGGVWAVFHLLRPLEPDERRELLGFCGRAGLRAAAVQAGRKHSLEPLGEDPGPMPFSVRAGGRVLPVGVRPGGFVQANPWVNQALVDEVASLAPLYRGGEVLELYAGAGNFTLPLGLEARRVVAVEGYPPAAEDLARNARALGWDHVEARAEPAGRALERLARQGFRPRFALLDPPREGAADAMEALADLAPEHILYVSCSPPTLVRDLGVLLGRGYRIEWIRAADMFPQTAHLESLTLLRLALTPRNGGA
ncbi:class I SAM-dependent RNA methyltransferase [Deferrisoma camini]|uniref:class I SAM-dependent RNA methyltransferase n=1 Tax=Deferrisoma camini TaxID=1035120 RepID=UPI00046D5280|nr:class I SAM-dependent RNA methyltransferase [Deferrisoma camini]